MRSTSRRGWQSERRDDLPLSEVLYVLWGWRLFVAGMVAVLVLLVVLFNLLREPVYTAEAAVTIVPRERLSDNEEKEAFLEEVRGAVVTREMLRDVMRRSGWEGDPAEFKERLDPRFLVQDVRLQVRFSGFNPEQAARAANAYADLFVARVENLNDERLAGGALAADAAVESRATPPGRSNFLLYAGAAVMLGALAGGAAALLLDGRTHSWRDARDVEMTLRAPVLGVIPDYSAEKEG